jgi:hypothetical protein
MKTPQQKVVHIQDKADKQVLSKVQKQFNTLIKKIDAHKKLLQEWQEIIPVYHSKVAGEYEDLWDEYNQYRVELVHLWDAAYGQKLFTKTDKNKLKHLIDSLTTELIFDHGMEELKDLNNKYSGRDFDSDSQKADEEAGEMMRSLFKEMTGIEIADDVDVSSPEKFEAALKAKIAEHQEQQTEQQRLAEEKRSKRKKTAKQLEKEAKAKQEEQNISKSIQEVYRKLVGVLHPDREPDEAERERKTKIMQEVNIAYEKKDLLRLLELQLELEHIDQAHLNNIAEDRLKYFNKILQEQLKELQQEIEFIENGLKMQAGWSPFMYISPKKLLAKIEYDIQDMANDIARLKADIKTFQTPESLKSFLKSYKIPKQHEELNLMELFFH